MINANLLHLSHLLRKISICELSKSQKSATLRIAKTIKQIVESDLSESDSKLNPMELIVELSDKRIASNKSWTDYRRVQNGKFVLSNFAKHDTLLKTLDKCRLTDDVKNSLKSDIDSLYK